jgi:hypothetical protein
MKAFAVSTDIALNHWRFFDGVGDSFASCTVIDRSGTPSLSSMRRWIIMCCESIINIV